MTFPPGEALEQDELEPLASANPLPGQQANTLVDWKKRRIAPHWSLLVAALVLWAFLIDLVRPYLNPLTLSIGILLLLYPSRRIRAIKPLLFLALVTALISMWWRLHTLITPFILAFLLAFALEPIIAWSVRRGLPRLVSILVLVALLAGLIIASVLLVLPKFVDEVGTLAESAPQWFTTIKTWFIEVFVPWAHSLNIPTEHIWHEIQPRLPGMANSLMDGAIDWVSQAVGGILGLITGIANLILIPILTIYFLNDFPKLRSWVYRLFPEEYQPDALLAYNRLNEVLSAFLRGQLIVCLFLATWISTGLALFAGLPYAILLGTAAGFLNLIPYVGTTFALIVTMIVAMFQPNPVPTALIALVVFVTGQSLEGNLLTPRIVGDKVGLHPIVVIFVVLLFATLFGVIGMLIAIPASAGAKVLWDVWRRRVQINAARFLSASS
jgi:predicted PurR-regulated permease PerM